MLTEEEYILIKNCAYNSIEYFRQLSLDEKFNFIKVSPFKEKNEVAIFISTLFFPNDLELIEQFKSNKDLKTIADLYKVPIELIKIKKEELDSMDLTRMIKERKISFKSTLQSYQGINDDNINLMNLLFHNNTYSQIDENTIVFPYKK